MQCLILFTCWPAILKFTTTQVKNLKHKPNYINTNMYIYTVVLKKIYWFKFALKRRNTAARNYGRCKRVSYMNRSITETVKKYNFLKLLFYIETRAREWANNNWNEFDSINVCLYGRFTSVETVMYLIKKKCLPVLIYGIEACPTHSSDIKTLDHPIIATFMKVCNTKSADVIRGCQMAFGFRSLHEQILTRKINFLNKFISCPNSICSVSLENCAKKELPTLLNQFVKFK